MPKVKISTIIFAVLFGIGAIVTFGLEIYLIIKNSTLSSVESGLFSTIEFALSIGFGWFIQGIESEKKFKDSLKDYAFSAHRRISDINKAMNRLILNIDNYIKNHSSDANTNLFESTKLIAEGVIDTIESAKKDWADVIGEELLKKEKIKELEQEETLLLSQQLKPSSDPELKQKILELRNEIENIRSELPILLRDDELNMFPRAGRFSDLVFRHYYLEIAAKSTMTFLAFSVDETTVIEIEKLVAREPFYLVFDSGMSQTVPSIYDKNDVYVLSIPNPFEDSGIYGNDYTYTFYILLGAVTKTTDTLSVEPQSIGRIPLNDLSFKVVDLGYRKDVYITIPADVKSLAFG